jgi:phosphonate transport system substrate-binding protein
MDNRSTTYSFENTGERRVNQGFGVFAAGWALATFGWAIPASAETVTVERGDTFSQIAARYTKDVSKWRSLYDPQRSNLPNPSLIRVGQKLELVTEPGGQRYLRAVGGSAVVAPVVAAAPSAPAPAPALAPAPTPAPAPVAAATAAATAGDDTLTVGVLPFIPAAALTAQYEHVRRYLERSAAAKVRIVVPANFKAFMDATMAGEYDVAVAAPHMARVAQLDRGMVPLGIYEPRIAALFVAPAEGGLAAPREAAGKAIGFANPQSLVAMYGQQWLRSAGLEPGRDYEVKGARTDLGVGRMMLTGEAVAAIMSNGEFRALPAEEGVRMKIVESFARIPNFIWLARANLERGRLERVRKEMRAFFADKDDGAAFAKASGLSGFVEVDDATLRELDPFAAGTRRALGIVR